MFRLLAFCLLAALFGTTVGYLRQACEGQGMSINCGSSRVIDISYASYGRTANGVCGNEGNTNCHAGSSMSVARRECQGLQRCHLQASNSVFGDPCGGTRKYLEVTYHCVRKSSPERRLRICEGSSHAIHCNGRKINIISANYGRLTGGNVCPGSIKTTNCGAAGSLTKVRNVCQGKPLCGLEATNNEFGDPCRGTRKYLEVRYKCQWNVMV